MKVLDVQDRMKAIVPPIEMCREIPEGEFKETVFICCVEREGKTRIAVNTELAREVAAGDFASIYPAPTFAEVIKAIRKDDRWGVIPHKYDLQDISDVSRTKYPLPLTIEKAMEIWFELYRKHGKKGGAW